MSLYTAGFSTQGIAQSMAAYLNSSAQITIAEASYAPATYASVVTTYTAFTAAVTTALDGGGGGPYTTTWSSTTGKYTISRATAFTLSFTGATVPAAGARLRLALGFTGNLSGASSYTSDAIPYYVIIPAMAARSAFTDVYEPDDIVEEAVSDGGTSRAVARQTSELLCDWTQTMETKAATLTRSALSTAPWTWQAFVKHVRGQRPFAFYDTTTSINAVYKLRAEGASFHPERVAADYDGLWNIPFRTRDIGILT